MARSKKSLWDIRHASYAVLGAVAAIGLVVWRSAGQGSGARAGESSPLEAISAVAPPGKPEPLRSAHVEKSVSKKSPSRKKNHLAKEKSPYLLQHVYNPVDWYAWGEEAFAKARKENKPIFLSIGYSTCHWCHVMEKESFTDAKIAGLLNENFVAIKVDREERPDIDKIYMTLATGAGWGGGWPLSIWMTPERKPFFGGTYFPPFSKWGRPGFADILTQVATVWKTQHDKIASDADRLAEALRENTVVSGREAEFESGWDKALYEHFSERFNPTFGGFGEGGPKFPMPVNNNFLMRYYARHDEKHALEMVETTLSKMGAGGIYDHIGGGFSRYSVDGFWRIPHFEKMLYDNAQLAVNALDVYQAGRNPEMARLASETLDYVLRDMTHAQGGFFSAEDADSLPHELAAKGVAADGHENKSEGAFYLWTADEVRTALGPDAEMFFYRYGVKQDGNALEDPQGEFTGKNILYFEHTLGETAKEFGVSERDAQRRLKGSLAALLKVRAKRPRSGLDNKVLASWNGLMLTAFARGYQVLEEKRYLDAAQKAADFLRRELYDEKTGKLYHRWVEGERKIPGMADDYAFLVQGLLDLYETSFNPETLEWAIALTETLQSDFFDKGKGGYFMTSEKDASHLLARIMVDTDNVEPSASSVAALNLFRLGQLAHREDFREAGELTLKRFGAQLRDQPASLPQMMAAVDFASGKPRQIILAGELDDPGLREMLRIVHARYMPGKILLVVSEKTRDRLAKRLPVLKGMRPIAGKPTAYVCVDFACELPTNDLEVVRKLLRKD